MRDDFDIEFPRDADDRPDNGRRDLPASNCTAPTVI
jgi:hypothetical protein